MLVVLTNVKRVGRVKMVELGSHASDGCGRCVVIATRYQSLGFIRNLSEQRDWNVHTL